MKSCNDTLAVLLDNLRFDDEGNPIVACGFACLQAEHRETSRETRYTTENGFECFGKMMGDKVLEDLNSGDPRLTFVRYPSLPTHTHDHLIVMHAIDQVPERIRENLCVGINLMQALSK